MIVDGKGGSFTYFNPEHANQLQRLAAKSRLKIPLLIGITLFMEMEWLEEQLLSISNNIGFII